MYASASVKLTVTLMGILSLAGHPLAVPVPLMVHPGDASEIVLTAEDTLNGTLVGSTGVSHGTAATGQLPLSFVNNFSGDTVNVYVTGLDTNSDIVFLLPSGEWYYPPSTTSSTPVEVTEDLAISLESAGSTTSITLPDYISSGRIWVAAGELEFFVVDAGGVTGLVEPSAVNPSDPSAGINWGFVELTNTEAGGLYADISYVDFVGMPLGISLLSADGSTQTAEGLTADAVSSICSALESQAAVDGQPWDELCVTDSSGTPVRVLAPYDYISLESTAFEDYFSDYLSEVWSYYETNTLTIDTQVSAGDVNCTVSDGTLTCDGDNRGYAQPSAADIFGCNSGPFAIDGSMDNDIHYAVVPRLCAAFDRSTLLLSGGNVQPSLDSNSYYTASPTNYYSKLVHEYEVDGKGYAFAYDDVTPTDATSAAGVVADSSPELLTITVGGPS